MSTCTILVTGASGQVGGAAVNKLAALGNVVAPGRDRLDLTSAESIRACVREVRPRWIVNTAAHTAVDKAESEPELAFAINAEAPRVLGQEARGIGAAVIHFSTDYVFDGSKASPYVETDATDPLNVYGRSKLAGEQALAETGVGHFIFRTSWVYGATGKNFLLSILRMARERERLRIVADQHGSPTWGFDLARLTAHVIDHVERTATGSPLELALAPISGVFHAAGAGETTWFGFAAAIVESLQRHQPHAKLASVHPITTADYPTPARRPVNSRLDCGKLHRLLGWRMMDWHDSLEQVMNELFPAAS